MRPILRNVYTGTKFKNYISYLGPLINAFGQNCSYCERIDKLDVEHVVPKSCKQGKPLKLDWSNLLLGCPRCNRDFKRSENTTRIGYLWPDTDNTFSCFEYKPDGRVVVKNGLPKVLSYKASKTLALLQLDDSSHKQPALCLYRQSQFEVAKSLKSSYLAGYTTAGEIVQASKNAWSVWMTVFLDEPIIVKLLVQDSISGTNKTFQY